MKLHVHLYMYVYLLFLPREFENPLRNVWLQHWFENLAKMWKFIESKSWHNFLNWMGGGGRGIFDFWNRDAHVLIWSVKFGLWQIIWGLKFKISEIIFQVWYFYVPKNLFSVWNFNRPGKRIWYIVPTGGLLLKSKIIIK